MKDVYPKFILEGDSIVMARVSFHKELIINPMNVKGGGWFKKSKDGNTYTFYGSSEDFGEADVSKLKACVQNDRVFTNRSKKHSIATKYTFRHETMDDSVTLSKF